VGTIRWRRGFSLNVLFRMLALGAAAAGLIYWKLDLVNEVYFREQITPVGLITNGAIIALFGVGLLKLIALFLRYAREERAFARFLRNLDGVLDEPLAGVPARSLIGQRYRTLAHLAETHAPINHGALASTLVAAESTGTSLPKFVNNTLILTGVFGTIVALSMALIGASDLLETSIESGGMGLVVHGMSTALSTTITAILCYFYFGYFYLKLTDVQTNLISGIEQVTATHLLPRFSVTPETLLAELAGILRSVHTLVGQLERSQAALDSSERQLAQTLRGYHAKADSIAEEMAKIRRTLSLGFRLPDESRP